MVFKVVVAEPEQLRHRLLLGSYSTRAIKMCSLNKGISSGLIIQPVLALCQLLQLQTVGVRNHQPPYFSANDERLRNRK